MRQAKRAKGQAREGRSGVVTMDCTATPDVGALAPGHSKTHTAESGSLSVAVQSYARVREGLPVILAALQKGSPITHAVDLARVPRQSFYELKAADADVAMDVAEARAKGAERYRRLMMRIARGLVQNGNANVVLHTMERLYPDDYAPPKQRVETTGAEGGPVQQAVAVTISRDEALSLARKKE